MLPSAPVVYVNNAGTSWPKAPPVADTVAQTFAADPGTHAAIFERTRSAIASAFGIPDPEELLLTPGCTSALSAALLGLHWEPGDVVVTSALEHQAMLRPIDTLVRLRGVVHHELRYRPGQPVDVDELAMLPKVRAVAMTAASNVTGERIPIAEVAAAAAAHGAFFVLDAAQLAGLAPLCVPELGADAVAFAGHKGPLGPQGIGGLWLAAASPVQPGYCDVGSVDLPAAAGLAASLEWLASSDAPPPEHAFGLREALRKRLSEIDAVEVLGGEGPATATLSFVSARLPVAEATQFFRERGVVLRGGRHCAGQALRNLGHPEGTIRASFGPFNTDDDVDPIVRALRE